MTQEALKKMYQLLLTEPHAPTVCAQLERIAREALADHAMQEVQRLGQEIEQEPVAWLSTDSIGERHLCFDKPLDNDPVQPLYTSPPQRKPLTDEQIEQLEQDTCAMEFPETVRAIEAAHGIKGDA